MDAETVGQVVEYAARGGFNTVDITGGAPEMNPNLGRLITRAAPLVTRVMLRANLTALGERDDLLGLLKETPGGGGGLPAGHQRSFRPTPSAGRGGSSSNRWPPSAVSISWATAGQARAWS